MRVSALCGAALCLLLFAVSPVSAHRVNIFAFVDGNAVQVECGFNRSQKVRRGQVVVLDATTGATLAQGLTDDNGVFRFPVTTAIREAGHDLTVRIVAGEGHQNDWTVAAAELTTAPASSVAPVAPAGAEPTTLVPASPVASPAGTGTASSVQRSAASLAPGVSAAEIERIVDTALDAKLSPIKRMLAEQTAAEPTLRDIIGGIGWIFGLIGVAAYFRRRP